MELQVGDTVKVYGYTSENYYYNGDSYQIIEIKNDFIKLNNNEYVHIKQCDFVSRPKRKIEYIEEGFKPNRDYDFTLTLSKEDVDYFLDKKVKITIEEL